MQDHDLGHKMKSPGEGITEAPLDWLASSLETDLCVKPLLSVKTQSQTLHYTYAQASLNEPECYSEGLSLHPTKCHKSFSCVIFVTPMQNS